MSRIAYQALETLFAHEGSPRQPVQFEWWLVRRKGQPFLLLPMTLKEMRAGLELYSPQRSHAKIWRAWLPWLLKTPAGFLFERIRFEADAGSEIMQFLTQQSGGVAAQLQTFAIKFGGAQGSRLVLLLCDETHRPVIVVKVGLNSAGHQATNREADLLEKLPPETIGCIHLKGRLKTPKLSAFATAYFRGDCPEDDSGMEHLFHAWLNPNSTLPLADLEIWQELAVKAAEANPASWQILSMALSGKNVRTTLYHGDFTPWNVRAVNMQNLQSFDWERGHLHGIPGWDWFHFFVQTSILSRRLSVERAAAEVEQLLHSARFQKYAAAAGISEFVQPLLLAYLLHQRWVIQPGEGRRLTSALFELLSIRWQMVPPQPADAIKNLTKPHLGSNAWTQLKSAAAQLSNLFWEPTLVAKMPPPLSAQFRRHWIAIFMSAALLMVVAGAHYFTNTNLVFLPFYALPCALLTWKVDRRWGAMLATVAAAAGPLIQWAKDTSFQAWDVAIWNMTMRFLTLQLCVLFIEQIHKPRQSDRRHNVLQKPPANLAGNWAVVLTTGLFFALAVILDVMTNPQMGFLPLYLLPCMVLTLVMNLRWGIAAAVLSAVCGSWVEYSANPNHEIAEIFGWNFIMRLAIFLLVIFLLDRIRRENILFFSWRQPPISPHTD